MKKEEITEKIGEDGKLIITDDMNEEQKEVFEYLNSININFNRNSTEDRYDDLEETVENFDESENINYLESENTDYVEEEITEDNSSADDLNDIF